MAHAFQEGTCGICRMSPVSNEPTHWQSRYREVVDTLKPPEWSESSPALPEENGFDLWLKHDAPHLDKIADEALEDVQAGKVVSDGGATSYYELPKDASELNDLIEHQAMGFARGNIFKACYRMGHKSGTDTLYDINKIIFFAERMRGVILKGGRV